jgi:hypothetical protein
MQKEWRWKERMEKVSETTSISRDSKELGFSTKYINIIPDE